MALTRRKPNCTSSTYLQQPGHHGRQYAAARGSLNQLRAVTGKFAFLLTSSPRSTLGWTEHQATSQSPCLCALIHSLSHRGIAMLMAKRSCSAMSPSPALRCGPDVRERRPSARLRGGDFLSERTALSLLDMTRGICCASPAKVPRAITCPQWTRSASRPECGRVGRARNWASRRARRSSRW